MKILLTPLLVSNFYCFGNNDKMLENSKSELQDHNGVIVQGSNGAISVNKAYVNHFSRYAFTR